MKNIRILLVIILGLTSIGLIIYKLGPGDGTTWEQRRYLDTVKHPKATKKEKTYTDTLISQGYTNVKLFSPIIGYRMRGRSTYRIEMDCPFSLTEFNKDSVEKASEDIALDLYSHVIEDPVIMELGEIKVTFFGVKIEKKKEHYRFIREYNKSTLANWSGFKVIEISPNKFKRVKS